MRPRGELGEKLGFEEDVGNSKGGEVVDRVGESDDDSVWKVGYGGHDLA